LKANLQKSEAAVAEYKAKTPDALQLAAAPSQPARRRDPARELVEPVVEWSRTSCRTSTQIDGSQSDQIRLEGELKQIEQAGENIDALLAVPIFRLGLGERSPEAALRR